MTSYRNIDSISLLRPLTHLDHVIIGDVDYTVSNTFTGWVLLKPDGTEHPISQHIGHNQGALIQACLALDNDSRLIRS